MLEVVCPPGSQVNVLVPVPPVALAESEPVQTEKHVRLDCTVVIAIADGEVTLIVAVLEHPDPPCSLTVTV